MVIPRSRSAGRKSVVVLPESTVPAEERYDDFSKIDSVKVVFPESEGHCEHSVGQKSAGLTDVSHKGHIA